MSGTGVVVLSLLLGLTAGVFSGMFGIGGGLIIVPALILIFHDSPKTAIGTSLFALMWPVGLLGVMEYWKGGQLRFVQGLWIAIGLFFGAYIGARITLSIPSVLVKKLYAIFLLVVGVYFLYSSTTKGPEEGSTPAVKPAVDSGPPQVH